MLLKIEKNFQKLEPFYYQLLFVLAAGLVAIQLSVTREGIAAVHMLSGVLFLNSTHVIFTSALFFELNKTSRIRIFRSWQFWGGLAFIVGAVTTMMWLEKIYNPNELRMGLLILFFAASRHHGISQTYGLLLLTNRENKISFSLSRFDY